MTAPTKCMHQGCKNTHKNPTGYCHEHAHLHDRSQTGVPRNARGWGGGDGVTCHQPLLQEERVAGFKMPEVI